MKAIVCKEFGPPSSLVYEDVEVPELKKSQILVDVHAAGVNFPDTLIQVCTDELLYNDAIEFVKKLRDKNSKC